MESMFNTTGNYAYTLVMEDGSVHPRSNQPCYGELRKYAKTHKDECTQPLDAKPGDLRSPFPDGVPSALYVSHHSSSYTAGLTKETIEGHILQYMLSNESPWNIVTKDTTLCFKPDGRYLGVAFTDLNIDPTVLVNLLKQCLMLFKFNATWKLLVEHGLTKREALLAGLLNAGAPMTQFLYGGGGYSFTNNHSVRRVLECYPQDYSGGTLANRVDYNRKSMGLIFNLDSHYDYRDPSLNSLTSFQSIWQKGRKDPAQIYSTKQIVNMVKSYIDIRMKEEPEQINRPWVLDATKKVA